MKQSDINHLRRLNAWVRCEIGPSPDEFLNINRELLPIVAKLRREDLKGQITSNSSRDEDLISPEAKQRLVERYDKLRAVPQEVRDAIVAIEAHIHDLEKQATLDAEKGTQKLSAPPPKQLT